MLDDIQYRRNSKSEIIKILICDLWGLNKNSLRMVIRSDSDFNKVCLVSIESGEITHGPSFPEELASYMDGNNKWNAKFKYFGRSKDLLKPIYGDYISDMADIVVYLNEKRN